MIELWKTLKAAEAQAAVIYNDAEKTWLAASAAKQQNPSAPEPVHPTNVIDALPAIRQSIGQIERKLAAAAITKAKSDLAAQLQAATPVAPSA
jgi:hypothetical protein